MSEARIAQIPDRDFNLNIQSDAKLLQFCCKSRDSSPLNALHAISVAAIFNLDEAKVLQQLKLHQINAP
jgi:hypothetical protein